MDLIWTLAALAAVIYCAVRSLLDLRQRRYVWAALSVATAAVIILAPLRPISVTIPIAKSR
jgi:hypothetical protein